MLSCEYVCIQSACHLVQHMGRRCFKRSCDREIGPAYLPLFGLYAADHSLQQWFSDAHIFTEPQEVYFRVKLRLAKGKVPEGIITDYVYLQCADDFRSGRIWSHFEERNQIKDIANLVAYIIWEIASSGRYKMLITEDLDKLTTPLKSLAKLGMMKRKISCLKLHKVIPTFLSEDLRKEFSIWDPLMRWLMNTKLQEGMTSFYGSWENETMETMRLQFMEDLMYKDVPFYGLECYPAKRGDAMHDSKDVDAIIRPYQDGCAPGLYFGNQLICSLDAIVSVKVVGQESNRKTQTCCVQLDRRSGPPIGLDFKTRAAAESFASVLESYYRMQVNFYYSLTEGQLASPSLKILSALRSFGPLREEDAVKNLGGSDGTEGTRMNENLALSYIIYQDCVEFNQLHVLAGGGGTDQAKLVCDVRLQPRPERDLGVDFVVESREGGQDGPVVYIEPGDMRIELNRRYGRQIVPREEKCRGMQCLEEEQLLWYSYTDDPGAATRKNVDTSSQPCLYEEAEISITESQCLGRGLFTDIYRTEHRKQGREVVVKKLTDSRPQVHEAYSRGVAHLHSLRHCSQIFVRYYGQMLLPPLRFVMESIPSFSLSQRLSQTPRLNLLQISTILMQLGHCLYDLKAKKMTYGSFCCKKILIHQETLERIRIRLGDPGNNFFLDTLDIDDQQNGQRLPWVAVERFTNLACHTIESEMYAVGTTIWEILTGKDPVQEIPHSVKDFFLRGNTLQAPGPSHVEAWVASQNFEGAKPTVADEAVSTYCKEARAEALSSGGESTTTSGFTTSGDTVTTTVSDPAQGDGAGQKVPAKQQIREELVRLMQQCWMRESSERPTPNSFILVVKKVQELAQQVKEEDPQWQARLVLEALQETHNITNPQAAQQLHETLSDRADASTAGGSDVDDNIARVQNLLMQSSNKFIDSSLLRYPETEDVLGSGTFGQVVKATLMPACESRQAQRQQMQAGGGTPVAVKRMSNESSANKLVFLKEALSWSNLHDQTGHTNSNIVMLHGIVLPTQSNPSSPLLLVMEYADKGSLETYVKSLRTQLGDVNVKGALVEIAKDITKGMEFLSEKKLIHGDLATRNILLFSKSSSRLPRAKITDFGLSHWLKEGLYYQKKTTTPIPVYWLAVEVLQEQRYNHKSDVWSFGTVLWEMFSGRDPVRDFNNPALRNKECPDPVEIIRDLINKYQRGERLPSPEHCPPVIYKIMQDCWDMDQDRRPPFSELTERLGRLTERDLAN